MSHQTDLSFLDRAELLEIIFPLAYSSLYSQSSPAYPPAGAATHFIEVERGVKIGCGFWGSKDRLASLLYFHGNGETVGDHAWVAQLYNQMGIDLFVSDFRGYGSSEGRPTISNMVRDCHAVFAGFKEFVAERGGSSRLFVMGRSLGSVPAVELAYHYNDEFRGLIIESGTASNFRAFWGNWSLNEKQRLAAEGFLNGTKIKSIRTPTCIIHGEQDEIIPVKEAFKLHENSGAADKDILVIPGAGHNDLMALGQREYFGKIMQFVARDS